MGFALWFPRFSTWTGTRGMHLEDLYVRPHAGAAGHGRALLASLAARCRRDGYERFEWWVLDWNEPAIGFYTSLGAELLDEWTVCRLSGGPAGGPGRPGPGRRPLRAPTHGEGARPTATGPLAEPREPRWCTDRGRTEDLGVRPGQAFLVSQKILSISAMSSSAFSPVFGSVEALAADRAFSVSLTSWCSCGYFSKCGGLK